MKIACPECGSAIEFAAAFEAAFCWGGNAVAFKCPKCSNAAHFTPIGDEIEVGFLGAAPTLDPVPGPRYAITVRAQKHGQTLTICWDGREKSLPSSVLYIRDHHA